ncbi:MAG: sugar ABC transporter permease [Candidatus Hydrogenedentota bacterium]|jgi:multiple sugar transport system permease protein|uniref:N-Acetyl-D-glucosamine ABC transport system, permease protein 1 n=1 Tax=Sumerlaea chitinivorans TaxID=2250252 RepID=A0A2Z4Y7F3_SUMC1|nr:N-Acetyl-D-glucosamine ABC transport system, permease protein 1 [Candidatus Sumerlaea chitinivorans]MCX7963073.1 sugar ABC transporter permease [Candidatus Sumerlaea chitinivorans]RMH24847.1 MAG: sugar ABC transporter permease [Candidatus Hydrogenedentota bacterium]
MRKSVNQRRALWKGLAFVSPWLLGFLLFTAYPIVASFYYSLCYYDGISRPHWIGLENYERLLQDPLFWKSLGNTLYFVALWIPLGLGFCLLAAVLLNQGVRGQSVFRALFYIPSITPLVAASVLWMWLLHPTYGLVNDLLRGPLDALNAWAASLGLSWRVGLPGWLSDPQWAKPALVLMSVWGMGNTILIFLAGLQEVPRSLYESAAIDGAGPLARFRYITLPMLSPVIFFNVVIGLIAGFQVFTQAYVMTRGGPSDATLFYAYYLFNNAFIFFNMGYASAMAWLLFVLVVACTWLVFKTSARWVYYAGEGT